jgi:hypothetical protein
VREPQFVLRPEKWDLWLTPLAVQFSDFRWTVAPHLPQSPDHAIPPGRTDAAEPAVPPRDDVVGWPDELLIDLPDFPDCTLDATGCTETMNIPRPNCLLLFLSNSLVEDSAFSLAQRSRRSRPYRRSRRGGRDELARTSGRVQ